MCIFRMKCEYIFIMKWFDTKTVIFHNINRHKNGSTFKFDIK